MRRRPDAGKRSLDEAIRSARESARREPGCNSGIPMPEGDLAELFTATSQELANTGNANREPTVFSLVEEGERQALSPTIKDDVCRIALELLRNAYQHAQAHRIEGEIRYRANTFRVRIRDDGKGIDPNALKEGRMAGHWGFRGIQESADRIGACMEVWSGLGAGTEIQLTVPASVAYETSCDNAWSRLFRR